MEHCVNLSTVPSLFMKLESVAYLTLHAHAHTLTNNGKRPCKVTLFLGQVILLKMI